MRRTRYHLCTTCFLTTSTSNRFNYVSTSFDTSVPVTGPHLTPVDSGATSSDLGILVVGRRLSTYVYTGVYVWSTCVSTCE